MADSQPTWPVMRVVGKSVFWVFAMVTFLIVAILAASNLISKYALKTYAEVYTFPPVYLPSTPSLDSYEKVLSSTPFAM